MFNVSDVSVAPLSKSIYVHPKEIHYTLNGMKKKWDYIEVHKSVAVIIFNITRKVFVLVRQFRPAVYIQSIPLEDKQGLIDCQKYPAKLGLTLEFCAGIIDKDKSLEDIAQEEIMEETGYEVPVSKLEKVRVFRSTIGASAGEVHLFYVEVEDHMRKTKGGGLESEGEFIEVVELPLTEAKDMCDGNTDELGYAGFLYGLLWFFHYKAPTINLS